MRSRMLRSAPKPSPSKEVAAMFGKKKSEKSNLEIIDLEEENTSPEEKKVLIEFKDVSKK